LPAENNWRAESSETKSETIKIRLTANILALVPVAYSAQSNGTGSFQRYKVSMTVDNQDGDAVKISADSANGDDCVYACGVPGIMACRPHPNRNYN
jgi:tellurite resistance protein TerA